MKLLILNGPNINMLGTREPEVYGKKSYRDLTELIESFASENGIDAEIFQSNHEGAIVDFIQRAHGKADGIVINPGAYTHYSYAIHDALKAVDVPSVEVHLSNIASREEFRRVSVTAGACIGQISGLGFFGYIAAMRFFLDGRAK